MFNLIPKAHATIDIGSSFKMGEYTTDSITKFGTLGQLISPLLRNAILLAGIIFFILIVFGGVTYIMNAGSGDKDGMEKGQNALTSAVLGLIIVFIAYFIIRIVEYLTNVAILNSGY